ncbi:uncharacterized protein LOC143922515 isoform X2 [Arctopsyche grandis]|uniref:uncharacterized protein LOC143922515 isoform X2 n=1 Tax=Arctopsyche grandis TaxID=121162 RepID=UPI00406D673F
MGHRGNPKLSERSHKHHKGYSNTIDHSSILETLVGGIFTFFAVTTQMEEGLEQQSECGSNGPVKGGTHAANPMGLGSNH